MDSDDEDDEDTVENYSDYYSSDPWGYLRAEVGYTLNPSYVKQVEQFLDKGASRVVAKAKASSYRLGGTGALTLCVRLFAPISLRSPKSTTTASKDATKNNPINYYKL